MPDRISCYVSIVTDLGQGKICRPRGFGVRGMLNLSVTAADQASETSLLHSSVQILVILPRRVSIQFDTRHEVCHIKTPAIWRSVERTNFLMRENSYRAHFCKLQAQNSLA